MGFENIVPDELSVRQQLETFLGAEMVVGAHGAGLANIVVCRPGTKVLELMPAHGQMPEYYKNLAEGCGHRFVRLNMSGKWQDGSDGHVDADKLEALVRRELGEERPSACDAPRCVRPVSFLANLAPIAYDIGMNNGDDSAYYLTKGYKVVAVEANSALCLRASIRFSQEIRNGQMTILNVAIGEKRDRRSFFLNTRNSVLSTFVPGAGGLVGTAPTSPAEWTETGVEVMSLSDIIRSYGLAEYVKIDIEGHDVVALKDLLQSDIKPPYLSAEAHTVDTYCLMVAMGYEQFKIVPGGSVATEFANHKIRCLGGRELAYSFPYHSSGPFGDDLPGVWMNKTDALRAWFDRGGGSIDLHAKSTKG
jgi:FkbM family methyltransferase